MSIVNLKIIFVKKEKQTRERPSQGRGARHSFITEMDVFTLETDYLCETDYPFDNSRQIIWKWNGFNLEWTIHLPLSVNFEGQLEDGLYISDSHPTFSPQKKSERGCLWGRGRLYTAFRVANAFRVTWSEQVFFLRYATKMPWPRLRGKKPYRD